jgi:uncharacterized radical SAM superfamily protein
MVWVTDGGTLVEKCRRIAHKGALGCLISGGCRRDGSLPWEGFFTAIATVKRETSLFLSVHCGLAGLQTIRRLKDAGVDQALIDVVGDDATMHKIYGIRDGTRRIRDTMAACNTAGLPVVPHIVAGIDYGRIVGEYRAIELVAGFDCRQVVIVSLMKVPGTPMAGASPPDAAEVADIVCAARLACPDSILSLGCARRRGDTRLELLAICCGVNRMAIPADEAVALARHLDIDIKYQKTCCSVSMNRENDTW